MELLCVVFLLVHFQVTGLVFKFCQRDLNAAYAAK